MLDKGSAILCSSEEARRAVQGYTTAVALWTTHCRALVSGKLQRQDEALGYDDWRTFHMASPLIVSHVCSIVLLYEVM
jgi:hypothetical protein